MFPEGDNIILTLNALKSQRQGIKLVSSPSSPPHLPSCTMIPQASDKTNNKATFRRNNLQRLHSAPILHTPSGLPPIKHGVNNTRRPSTPNVVSQPCRRTSSSSTRSLPRNYRINLDLTPLVEVGAYTAITYDRKRQSSTSNELSNDISSVRQRSLTPSPKTKLTPNSSRSTLSSEHLDQNTDILSAEENNKETMILNWLQSIEQSEETNNEQLLPSIKEGQPS